MVSELDVINTQRKARIAIICIAGMYIRFCNNLWDCAQGTFYQHGLTLIPAWISNHVPSNIWNEITYPFPNFNGASLWIDIFEVKLTFETLTVRGQQHSFSTHERVFLWKCKSFWDRTCLDLKGTRTPNLRIYAECSNLFSYQGQTFAVPCFLILYLVV